MIALPSTAKRRFAGSLLGLFRRPARAPRHDVGPDEFWQQEIDSRYDFFRKALTALKFNGIEGDYAEFGCNGAMTFRMVHKLQSSYTYALGPFHQWAFDSFQGLPRSTEAKDEHPRWIPGQWATPVDDFHRRCADGGLPRTAYTVVPGFYEQSLDPAASGPRPEKIRLAYIDCDLYSSTRDVLAFLMPRLQHGMILAFDDYHCYSATLPSGERLAAIEAFAAQTRWRLVPYVHYGWHGMSFIVESTATPAPAGEPFAAF